MAIESGSQLELDIKVKPVDGDTFPIRNADILEDSFCIDRYVQTGDNIEIGTCAAAELTMELNNYDGRFNDVKFEGAEMRVAVYIKGIIDPETNLPKRFNLGYFTVDQKPRLLDTISISALDKMVQFDKLVDDSLAFGTITFLGLVTHCCEKCSVSFNPADFIAKYPLYDRIAVSKPEVDNLTYRNLIQYVAQLGMCCAYIDADGFLQFGFYGDTNPKSVFQLNHHNMFSHTIDEKAKGIACLTIKSGEDSATATIAESQQLKGVSYSLSVNLEDLPLSETSASQQVVETLFNKKILRKAESSGITWNQFQYIPYSAQTLPYFFLEPLDVIQLDDLKTNLSYRTVVAHTTFRLNQNMLVEAKGESETQSGYATLNPLTAEEQRIINELRKNVKDDAAAVKENISNRTQLLIEFNKALNSGGALYRIQSSGYYTVYADAEDAEHSTRFIAISSAGVGWSDTPWKYDDTEEDDFPTVCKYFMSFDGTAVLSNLDSYRIRADLIECDDLQALHATIGGWNIIDNAIYSSYIKDDTEYNVYIKTPESTSDETGSYFIGVKNMSTKNYAFAISPLGEIKTAGSVRSMSGFRVSSDFMGDNPIFAVDINGVSTDEPSIKMRVKGDSDVIGKLRANDIAVRTDSGLLYLKDKISNLESRIKVLEMKL